MVEAVADCSDVISSGLDSRGLFYDKVHEVLKNAEIADLLFWKLVHLGLMDYEKTLGKGATGTVYQIKGEEGFLGKELALKIFNFHESNTIPRNVICGDILALRLPSHSHLCQSFGLLTYDGSQIHYIEKFNSDLYGGHILLGTVSRAIAGETLHEIIQSRFLDTEELKSYGKQLSEAVLVMHKAGVAHQDIHPDNILVEKSSCSLQLIDFYGAEGVTPDRMRNDWRRVALILIEMAQEDLIFDPYFYDLIYSEKHGLLNGHQLYKGEQVVNHPFFQVYTYSTLSSQSPKRDEDSRVSF